MKSKIALTKSIAILSIPHPFVVMSNKVLRGYTFIGTFGLAVMAIFILVDLAGAAPLAYVTSMGIDTGTVYVIDTESNNVTYLVPVEG